ncbi:alkaline phosphatase D [Wenyingzhuangia heitensis]|uniref:Alkaline phosphatase D n=1 Tax=Wenyingzhuangia heitensis TaxID=1487859 RepID=A0ABX0U8N9_9FLAO|nr:alkaline phosphatase D family protein [Wenyingzhuangia heitensis]NIJ45210.1 alkaline phosphatase D [Wenyingzhuangia heitensis]
MATPNKSRRQFIQNALMATGGIILAPNFISCSDDDLTNNTIDTSNFTNNNFQHGVGSFDPTSSKVIIWTRYSQANKEILWEVATDSQFNDIIRNGAIVTDAERDNTLAIELTELTEGLKLYYRFINEEDQQISVVGETITLPENASSIKLAVCSCSNYQAGLFNVYNAMAKSEADIIVHLGDYFYEYQAGGYGANDENAFLNRFHEPEHEIVSLEDYRTRYKQYKTDADLQLAHQKKPFICVWDDHEVANDTYKDGAENHSASEGPFETRKNAALKAYSEYLPFTKLEADNESLIYRTFNIGNLVNLIMLDTRVIGRDKQLNIADYFTATGLDGTAFEAAVTDSNRTLLGTTQRDWLFNQLSANTNKWQVLGQQVLMGKMNIPADLLMAFGTADFNDILAELVTLKVRLQQNDPTLTTEELTRINSILPYNLDAWDGYYAERELIYNTLGSKKIVTLAGDTHNGWSSKLVKQDKTEVGIEIATASISSPGFEEYLGGNPSAETLTAFEGALTTLIDDLTYFNSSKRGFVMTTFTNTEVTSEWIYVDTLLSSSYTTETAHTVTFS